MSQFFVNSSSGGGGGSPINEIDTQNGNATPIANIIIMNGFDTVANNDNGISTAGGVVGTGVQNEVDVLLTNRTTGTVTTTDATITTILTFSLGATLAHIMYMETYRLLILPLLLPGLILIPVVIEQMA